MATLTLRNVDDELLDFLTGHLGEKTASKALLKAASGYLDLEQELMSKNAECMLLQQELQRKDELLKQIGGLCVQVSEIVNQKELEV